MVLLDYFLRQYSSGRLRILPIRISKRTVCCSCSKTLPFRILGSILVSWDLQIHCTLSEEPINHWWLEYCRNFIQCCLSENQASSKIANEICKISYSIKFALKIHSKLSNLTATFFISFLANQPMTYGKKFAMRNSCTLKYYFCGFCLFWFIFRYGFRARTSAQEMVVMVAICAIRKRMEHWW